MNPWKRDPSTSPTGRKESGKYRSSIVFVARSSWLLKHLSLTTHVFRNLACPNTCNNDPTVLNEHHSFQSSSKTIKSQKDFVSSCLPQSNQTNIPIVAARAPIIRAINEPLTTRSILSYHHRRVNHEPVNRSIFINSARDSIIINTLRAHGQLFKETPMTEVALQFDDATILKNLLAQRDFMQHMPRVIPTHAQSKAWSTLSNATCSIWRVVLYTALGLL